MIKRVEVRPRNRRTRQAIAWWHFWAADERGSVTVMVALTITGLIALLALAIDLSALFDARSEAQRAADAAALAGASAFLDYQQDYARSIAVKRAMEYATHNEIRNTPIEAGDVTISVNLDSSTVRVHVRRNGVHTWFARLFGVDAVDIGADATAWAGEAGAAQCVKPFALPDMWEETTQDVNHNRIWDDGERWQYNPADGDRYVPYSGPGGASNETGYGSDWRDGYTDGSGRTYEADYGRRVTVKTTDPHQTITPSFFLPWVLPIDGNQADCGATRSPGTGNGGGDNGGSGDPGSGDKPGNGNGNGNGWFRWVERRGGLGGSHGQGPGNGGDNGGGSGGGVGQDDGAGRGAARYRRNICTCNNSIIDLDTRYLIEPGNMVGPTYQGVKSLIDQDPDAYWDDRSNTVVSKYGMDSPRVITVALFDPSEISKPGRQYIRFNNFARVFIEKQASPQDPVTGRMLYYVRGVGSTSRDGKTTGSLVRTLQLIR